MGSFIYKAIDAAVVAYLLSQQIERPPLAIPLIVDVAIAVGTAGVGFGIDVASNAISVGNKLKLKKRQNFRAPAGVPQLEFDRCYHDLASVTIRCQAPIAKNGEQACIPYDSATYTDFTYNSSTYDLHIIGMQLDNIPSTCMNLATFLDGNVVVGPIPQPCGLACLLSDKLSSADYETMPTPGYPRVPATQRLAHKCLQKQYMHW